MADRYNNLNNTAPEVDPLKQKNPSIDKSDFDLGQALYFQALDGMIIPFWHLRVIPNSSIDLSINIRAIMTNPYVKQLVSGKRAYVHVYHSSLSDLWEGAPELLKKGRDFNTKLKIPTLSRYIKHVENGNSVNCFSIVAGSPSSYLGMPVQFYDPGTSQSPKSPLENIKPISNSSDTKVSITNYANFEFSCLPLVMYQQIYQAHYLNKNLINNNTDWLPQVENHFILPLEASGEEIAKLSYDINQAKSTVANDSEDFDFNSEIFVPRNVTTDNPQTNSNKPFLNVMRFRQFKGDMFTAGSPFPDLMRGDVPVMSFSDLTGTIDWSKCFTSTDLGEDIGQIAFTFDDNQSTQNPNKLQMWGFNSDGVSPTANQYATDAFQRILNKAVVNVQNQLSFNLNALRALDVYTLLGERAARTDGTYNNYIKTMFNVDPRYHMHEPRYLGGFYIDFVNQTIEQTSESNTTALGTTASRGIASGNGHIGKFSFNDHGYLMAVLDIVDETIYTGGVDRDWTDLTFEDQYLPLFNGLAPQATRVQELFLTGVKATNDKPFNYVERYSHLKSRRNKALGQMSLPAFDSNNNPISPSTAPYMHMRRFISEPTFNNLWVTMTPKNIDMTPYSSVNDYPFLVTATTSVDAVLPLPYITVPSGLAIMA